jgi:hypothetical protein
MCAFSSVQRNIDECMRSSLKIMGVHTHYLDDLCPSLTQRLQDLSSSHCRSETSPLISPSEERFLKQIHTDSSSSCRFVYSRFWDQGIKEQDGKRHLGLRLPSACTIQQNEAKR